MRARMRNLSQKSQLASCRIILIAFCLIQGLGRLLIHDNVAAVNIIPSDWYAVLMLGTALGLGLTAFPCHVRAGYMGRLIAVFTLSLWLLLAFDVANAPISCGNAFIIALIAGHEVFYRAC